MNRMKGFAAWLCAMAMLMPVCASAEVRFEGKVAAGETVTVFAPYGGMVKSLELREGQWIERGAPIAQIETTKVFAAEDGTVRGVYAQPGDSAEGTVLNIAPVNKYTVSANIEKAYSRASNKYVVIGEKVYISCAKDGTHRAVGIVKSVSGSDYTVETTGGELYLEETVNIYRSPNYNASSRIGSGTVARTAEIVVSGKGSLLRMHVADGEDVERGQLLFETVEGTIDALTAMDQITAPYSGVVAQVKAGIGQKVEKGGVLVTVYPAGSYQIEMPVTEDMLPEIKEGDEVKIYFDWNAERAQSYTGTIESISYMKVVPKKADDADGADGADKTNKADDADDADAAYTAYVSFEADENVRIGMTASIVKP